MSIHHDHSGFSGPRLGLGHDSGWSHLAGGSDSSPGDSMGLDFDQIADDAVREVFGRGPVARAVARRPVAAFRATHPVAAWRATHPRLAARRDYLRAGWGSPGWQSGTWYPESVPFEEVPAEDDLSAEVDEFLARDDEEYGEYDPEHWHGRRGGPVVAVEEEYGEYTPAVWHGRRGGPVVAAEEEYGRRGGGRGRGRHPVRRAVRRARHRRRERRERREAGWGSPWAEPIDASRTPLGFDTGMEPEEEPWYPEEEEYEEEYGNDDEVAAPTQQPPSTFRAALETGVGLGIGFMGVALGMQLLARAMSRR